MSDSSGKPRPELAKKIDRLMRDKAEVASMRFAIMMLMAEEARRNENFPQKARKWLDRSLASISLAPKSDFFVYAREEFQDLLGSADRVVAQNNRGSSEDEPIAISSEMAGPVVQSWWKFW